MPVVVAFVSQKGGVGKSTLARGLGAIIAHAGLRVRIADVDARQSTVLRWFANREGAALKPLLDAKGFATLDDALADAEDVDLLIIDSAGGFDRSTLHLAQRAHLVVLPTSCSLDDLHPTVLGCHELVAAGIPRDRLVVAICRTLSNHEEQQARKYLQVAGYDVLPGALPERAAYRDAQNRGKAITETDDAKLNQKADSMLLALMTRVASEVQTLRATVVKSTKREAK